MQPTDEGIVWPIEVLFDETEDETQAEAVVELTVGASGGGVERAGTPHDPAVPRIGEKLAAARALSSLSHRLLDDAARSIEEFEGGPVHVHP